MPSKTPAKNKDVKGTKPNTAQKPAPKPSVSRTIKTPTYRSFKLEPKIRHPKKLKSSFRLLKESLRLIRKHWRVYAGISLIYFVLSIIFVRGFRPAVDLTSSRETLSAFLSEPASKLSLTTSFMQQLFGSLGSTPTEVSGAYQSMLLLIVSLAIIWALRQHASKQKITIRDTFYKGIYPLVPFLLVLMVIGLQMLPALISGQIYVWILSLGLAVTGMEKVLWSMLMGLFALLSMYMVLSSMFALYIVTLPDVKPIEALKSARGLVLYRRLIVVRRVLFLPLLLVLLAVIIMLPIVLFATFAAAWVFYALTIMSLVLVHAYLFMLYRNLIEG